MKYGRTYCTVYATGRGLMPITIWQSHVLRFGVVDSFDWKASPATSLVLKLFKYCKCDRSGSISKASNTFSNARSDIESFQNAVDRQEKADGNRVGEGRRMTSHDLPLIVGASLWSTVKRNPDFVKIESDRLQSKSEWRIVGRRGMRHLHHLDLCTIMFPQQVRE